MEIRRLSQIPELLISQGSIRTIAVAAAEDPNTLGSVRKAVESGIARYVLLGDRQKILDKAPWVAEFSNQITLVHQTNQNWLVSEAVALVKQGDADILTKGMVNTDTFLKAVLNSETGLMKPKQTMSYVCAIEVPAYPKLMFITDTAVLVAPDLNQKLAMMDYSISMARRFGITKPRVALIASTEKVSEKIRVTEEYSIISKMGDQGRWGDCIVDGPLDVFLACDPQSGVLKGVDTPIGGQADILLFPNLDAANAFYKGLMLFAGGELAGLIQGTTAPVVVMSRNESELSKYYCQALACLMV